MRRLWGRDAAFMEPLLLIGSEATPVEASTPYFACLLCKSTTTFISHTICPLSSLLSPLAELPMKTIVCRKLQSPRRLSGADN